MLPILFLLVYFFKAINYAHIQELLPILDIVLLISGFVIGVGLSIAISFIYFFGADKTIYYTMAQVIQKANSHHDSLSRKERLPVEKTSYRVDWFLTASLKLRKPH